MKPAPSLRQYLLHYALAYLTLVVLVGGLAGYVLYLWRDSSRETLRLNSMMQEVQQTRGSLYLELKEVFDAVFLDDPDALRQYDEHQKEVERHLGALDKLASGADESQAVATLRKNYETLRAKIQVILRGHGDMPLVEKQRVLNTELEAEGIRNHERAIEAIEQLLELQRDKLNRRLDNLNRLAPLLLLLPIALALALLWFSRAFLRRAVVTPLLELERATHQISQGTLIAAVPEQGPQELASLARSVNRMARDLAESRESLLRAEKQATLGALVPVLAHNIRNPIASIRAAAQVIGDANLSAELREDLAGIIDTADRLERWTRSLLSYLHPLKPRLAPVQLSSLIDNAVELLKPRIAAKNLRVTRHGWKSAGVVQADAELLEQALHGLLLNAVEASPVQGTLALVVAQEQERVHIAVKDEGPGIRITPAAGGLVPGPTTKTHGTGLGIPFALKVVEEHGGKIAFNVMNPRGTEVLITLPTNARAMHDGS